MCSDRRVPALAAALAAVLAAGCTEMPDGTPRPTRLSPGGGPADAAATVTISGAGFHARAVQSASGGPAMVDATHRAWLDLGTPGEVELATVTWVDSGTLRAAVPAGLALGPHALTVENALGKKGTLDAAWTTIDPAALTVTAAAAPATAVVGQAIALDLTLANTGGTALRGVTVTVSPSGTGAASGGLTQAPFDLEAGAIRQLRVDLAAASSGGLSLAVSAEGREDFSGRLVTAAAPAVALSFQDPAVLAVTAAAPAAAVAGQGITLDVNVANTGGTALRGVAVTVAPSGTGAVMGGAAPAPFDLDPGAARQLRLALTADLPGEVSLAVSAEGLEDLGGRLVAASAAAPLVVQAPAALTVSASAPPVVVVGQAFILDVAVANPGGTALAGSRVSIASSGPGGATGQPAPAALDLGPGESRRMQLAFTGSAPGDVTLVVSVEEIEDLTGRPVSASAPPVPVRVQAPAALALTAAATRAQASVGQALTLAINATNTGGTALRGVAVTVTPSGAGAVAGDLAPAPFDLDPGASRALPLALAASAAGAVTLDVSGQGTEDLTGRPVATAAPGAALLVQARAALRASLAIPSNVPVDTPFAVTMTVENTGEAAALAVVPGSLDPLTPDTTATVAQLSGPTPSSATVTGLGRATFTWSWRLTAAGDVRLRGGAAGTDANDGAAVVAPPVDSNLGAQLPEVMAVATDPLGDGTPVAALAVRAGQLLVGPGGDGSDFWRLDGATGASGLVGVQVAVDDGPSQAQNSAWQASPPATTFGAAGCAASSTACGPNDERGLGVLGAGWFSGAEWLAFAGATWATPSYLHLSRQAASPLPFAAVDLVAVVPSSATGPTTLAFAPSASGTSDRIYLALSGSTSRESPRLVALATAPGGPWMDAVEGTDAVDLGAELLPGLGGGAGAAASTDPVPRLDALAWIGDRLHLASGGGVARSTVPVPRSYATSPSDWVVVTPSASEWGARTSVPATASVRLTPADRAVPALAVFDDCGAAPCVLMARNVVGAALPAAPQLWVCDTDRTGPATTCEAGDWYLAAANDTGDVRLSQMDDPGNGALSVLLATQRYLYVGYDNATTGVQLYRVEAGAYFLGRDGCTASFTGCEGLGGNGFGAPPVAPSTTPPLTRFFDARAVTGPTGTTVYVAVGDGARPLRIYALPE